MERRHKTTLIITIFFALICQTTHAQEDLEDGLVSFLQRRAVNPKLKPGLPTPKRHQKPQKSISYVVKQPWQGEKPRLVGPPKATTPSTRTGIVDPQHKIKDTHQGGCKECFRKIQNLADLCRFKFALRVRPIQKDKHRYDAQVLAVYRDSPELSLEPDISIRLHLAETDEQPLAINKDLSRCSCPYLMRNVSYIVFGRASRLHKGVVTVMRAHRFSSNHTIANHTEARLRSIALACNLSKATAPTGQVQTTLHSNSSMPSAATNSATPLIDSYRTDRATSTEQPDASSLGQKTGD